MRIRDAYSKNKPERIQNLVGWNSRSDVDVIVNMDGSVLQPISKVAGVELYDLRWGTVLPHLLRILALVPLLERNYGPQFRDCI